MENARIELTTVTENLQKVLNFYVPFLLHRACFRTEILQILLTFFVLSTDVNSRLTLGTYL